MKKGLSTIASLILSVFFICVMLFIMLGVMDITEKENGTNVIIFSVIDFFILLVVVGLGKPILSKIKTGLYAPICAATIVYIAIAFGLSLGLFSVVKSMLFVALKLILIFIYFCIIIPIAVTGANSERNEECRPEIKKHNL